MDSAIRAATKAAIKLRGDFKIGSKPTINVVFHVPGSLGCLDWDGIRDAKYSRKQKLLMIQVAVPENIGASITPEDFVIQSLYGANAIAFEFFRQKGIAFPLAEAEQLVSEMEGTMKGFH